MEHKTVEFAHHHQPRALIVDDDLAMTRALHRQLHKLGFETLIAHGGFEAGAILKSFQPVLMTLDLSMPGVNGFQMLRMIRSNEQFAGVKILVISALPREKLAEALAHGADEVLEKPFRNEQLAEKIRKIASCLPK